MMLLNYHFFHSNINDGSLRLRMVSFNEIDRDDEVDLEPMTNDLVQ
jgi:hypothetical protein